jgi:hypothetical protein
MKTLKSRCNPIREIKNVEISKIFEVWSAREKLSKKISGSESVFLGKQVKIIAREMDSRFGWKLEDFLFDTKLALKFSSLYY